MSQSAKKQQSLTNFFKRQPPSSPAGPVKCNLSVQEAAAPVQSTRKRPLEEGHDDKADEEAKLRPKRAKNSAEGNASTSTSTNTKTTTTTLTNRLRQQITASVNETQSPPSSDRTSQFRYDSVVPPTADNDSEDDLQAKQQREELHRRFVKKLGNPDALVRRKKQAEDEREAEAEAEAEDGEDEEPPPQPQPVAARRKGAKTGKLTPMELQVIDIKRKHRDTVLVVEVGYKFRFFGEDARIASKELSIMCIPGKFRFDEHPSEAHLDKFASASIPVHRLPVHVKRLVAAGHKVGVVRQIETAALKKAGDNRNAPFERKLTNVYTKGTYIDDLDEPGQQNETAGTSSSGGGYLLCIVETPLKGTMGTDEKVEVGILAVQPATGDIIYDTFEDGFMRSELETRILHISPCEFLIVGELSKTTDKLVQHLSGSSTNVFGDRCRVERVERTTSAASEASSHVTRFYADMVKRAAGGSDATPDSGGQAALLDTVLTLSEPVTICLSAMIKHLDVYGLDHVFDLTKYFQSFNTRSHMLINGTTLESLEVYRNQTDMTEKGSLLWAIDKTLTRFGHRLLRKWIGRPLLDETRLTERVTAVEELLEGRSGFKVDELEKLLRETKGDLERSLIRIYYGKCSRKEVLLVLQNLQRISMTYSRVTSPDKSGFNSPLISECVATLPLIKDTVVGFLDKINAQAARKDDKYSFFREEEETEEIADQKLGIASVETELDVHRQAAATKLGRKKPVDYTSVSGIDYLIEVLNTELKKVPASWVKISGTKRVSRFHTPEVVRLIQERDQHRESLSAACDRAFKAMLADVAQHYQPMRDAVTALGTLDCLLSLSKIAALPGYSKPIFLSSTESPEACIDIVGGRHPVAEQMLVTGDYIPFTMRLASPAPLAQVITGPNMGGKSSYVRAVALLALLAQTGSFVPAQSLRLTPVDAIFARMGARDNLFAGESTFMVELGETAAMLRAATPRSLVLLDELGRGTSTHDGAAIAASVLHYMVEDKKCLTLFVTHYQDLSRTVEQGGFDNNDAKVKGLVKNVHMAFEEDGDEVVTFKYEVAEGMAHRSYGLNVARLARLPAKVVQVARSKSQELEHVMEKRRLGGLGAFVGKVLRENKVDDDGADEVEMLLKRVQQL